MTDFFVKNIKESSPKKKSKNWKLSLFVSLFKFPQKMLTPSFLKINLNKRGRCTMHKMAWCSGERILYCKINDPLYCPNCSFSCDSALCVFFQVIDWAQECLWGCVSSAKNIEKAIGKTRFVFIIFKGG